MDTLRHYLDTFEALRSRKRWTTDTEVLRFAALALGSLELADPGRALEDTARTLYRSSSALHPLKSPIRHAVAAMILRRELDPVDVVRRLERIRRLFRQHRLRRGGAMEVLAALILVLDAGERPVAEARVIRLREIFRRWKDAHPWLTGNDDYPMAALHATRDEDIDVLAYDVERVYEALRARRFSRGNPLQLVSHILALSPHGPDGGTERFLGVVQSLRQRGERIGSSQWDEAALIALLDGDPAQLAGRLLTLRDALRQTRHRPNKAVAYSLAAGLVLAEAARAGGDAKRALDARALQAVQAALDAQQAAVIACIAATSVAATTAATSAT